MSRNERTNGYGRRALLMALAVLILAVGFAPTPAPAVERPEWPTVGRVTQCTYQWPGDIPRKSRTTFTSLGGQPHHSLRRGTTETQLLDLNGNPVGDPFTNRVDIAWKPNETPQDPAGTTFELTIPNAVQCKRFTVKTRGGWPACIEEHVYDQCDNQIQQTCFLVKSCR